MDSRIGFENLGASFRYDAGETFYRAEAPNGLQGNHTLDEASAGTANIVITAALAKGTTTIYNAAASLISSSSAR